jgi:hypothetical protein
MDLFKKNTYLLKKVNICYENICIIRRKAVPLFPNLVSPVKTERSYILERKERDFLDSFDAVVKELRSQDVVFKTTDICKLVAKMSAPCFYVSLETAIGQYQLYKRGKSNIRDEERRKMFAEIFVRFENLMKQASGSMYQYAAMELVLSQPAPSYYLADGSAIVFYYNARKKKRLKYRNK